MTKEAMDEPFAVYHSHSARLLLSNQIESVVSVGGNRLVWRLSLTIENMPHRVWLRRSENPLVSVLVV